MRLLPQRLGHDLGRLLPRRTRIRATPQIRDALSGLKCRCGTHVAILRAVKRAAQA